MRPLLASALAAAPLDLGELWAVALRFGLFGLLRARDPAAQQLLGVVSAPVQDGGCRSPSPACHCRNTWHAVICSSCASVINMGDFWSLLLHVGVQLAPCDLPCCDLRVRNIWCVRAPCACGP